MDQKTFDQGLQIRRDMFGGSVDREVFESSDFERPLQDLVTEYCFGEVWSRAGFDRKTRSLLTVAMLIGVNRLGPLKIHVKGAIANGATKDDIREVILHAAVYCGVPAANEATRVAKEAFAELGIA